MKALQFTTAGAPPEVVEIPTPTPTGREVLLRVTAAGACHSDDFVMSQPPEMMTALGISLPLTLGHEGAGVVEALGTDASGLAIGDEVAVFGAWGCGRCRTCQTGAEQYCERAGELGIRPPGLGAPGAMAEFMIVDDSRHLVPLLGLDPVKAAPLTDAGLTPYHAIKPVLSKLVPGSTAVVIGAGGLGHLGIQILKALSSCQVIVLDIGDDKLAFAQEMGADHAFTSALSAKIVHFQGDIVIVGIGGGTLPVGFFTLPYNVSVRAPYWGTIPELHEVLALGRSGLLKIETETFSLADAPTVYERMHARSLRGRGVVVP